MFVDSLETKSMMPDRSSRRGGGTAKRVLYRCKFCRLKTYVRTDMRHHLMREIAYKPYRCGHCYAAAGGKVHFICLLRTQHSGKSS